MGIPHGIQFRATVTNPMQRILTPEALAFVQELHERFAGRRSELLARREVIQQQIDEGWNPGFLSETAAIREGHWTVAPVPADLQDRRVEITGPVERKMVINALNSGAKVFMADFEDSHSPTWSGTIQGQINLADAVRREIEWKSPEGKEYKLNASIATLMVRPRGWHLEEKHVECNGKPLSASLFDFGLFFFHNAKELLARGTGPYFYLPKMESHLEARLWNDVFVFSQKRLAIPVGTIKATVLIETILAAFEMDEILYELRDHSAGLNCGRWDYIFSFIKKFRNRPDFVLPDRSQVTMLVPFLKSYTELLVQTCHHRGIHAMGGMAAQIPIKGDDAAHREAVNKVIADKEREVKAGHDGTWVAHPGLVPVAREVFDTHMKEANQIARKREDIRVLAADLLAVPKGTITESGFRHNISVGLQYLEAWHRVNGCVPLYHLMEDAATAEICRAQLWQWIHQPSGKFENGTKVTIEKFRETLAAETAKHSGGKFELASRLFEGMVSSSVFPEFLTLSAYNHLLER